jgi:hypothetical protein
MFIYSTTSRPALGPTQLLVQWVPGVKRPGHEADHSFPSSAEVKNDGVISPLPHSIHGVCLINLAKGQVCLYNLPITEPAVFSQ